ncbi:MAG: hypothetical protein AVDCRST_MAG13-1299 [uncultured Solirubrobacteraceae bacterium]|uniref:Uncharacterized protein n=1 Tax=uncultured Solirubrobacteraceae bacterium TaxID=1162706 RepID=A0A6J4RWT7_9ACTN|nr:MAG: hypothetical protein AVDCRST_MAG13-1299 [uncultured Solirubrobacteraceae bacterium]
MPVASPLPAEGTADHTPSAGGDEEVGDLRARPLAERADHPRPVRHPQRHEREALHRADDARLLPAGRQQRGAADRHGEVEGTAPAPRPLLALARGQPVQRLVGQVRGERAVEDHAVRVEVRRVGAGVLGDEAPVHPRAQAAGALVDPDAAHVRPRPQLDRLRAHRDPRAVHPEVGVPPRDPGIVHGRRRHGLGALRRAARHRAGPDERAVPAPGDGIEVDLAALEHPVVGVVDGVGRHAVGAEDDAVVPRAGDPVAAAQDGVVGVLAPRAPGVHRGGQADGVRRVEVVPAAVEVVVLAPALEHPGPLVPVGLVVGPPLPLLAREGHGHRVALEPVGLDEPVDHRAAAGLAAEPRAARAHVVEEPERAVLVLERVAVDRPDVVDERLGIEGVRPERGGAAGQALPALGLDPLAVGAHPRSRDVHVERPVAVQDLGGPEVRLGPVAGRSGLERVAREGPVDQVGGLVDGDAAVAVVRRVEEVVAVQVAQDEGVAVVPAAPVADHRVREARGGPPGRSRRGLAVDGRPSAQVLVHGAGTVVLRPPAVHGASASSGRVGPQDPWPRPPIPAPPSSSSPATGGPSCSRRSRGTSRCPSARASSSPTTPPRTGPPTRSPPPTRRWRCCAWTATAARARATRAPGRSARPTWPSRTTTPGGSPAPCAERPTSWTPIPAWRSCRPTSSWAPRSATTRSARRWPGRPCPPPTASRATPSSRSSPAPSSSAARPSWPWAASPSASASGARRSSWAGTSARSTGRCPTSPRSSATTARPASRAGGPSAARSGSATPCGPPGCAAPPAPRRAAPPATCASSPPTA